MKTLLTCMLALAAFAVRADVVTEWNVAAWQAMRAAQMDGGPGMRTLSLVHVAMADAINTVENRHTRFAYKGALEPNASAEAAAAGAARAVLLAVLPAHKARIDEAYAATTRNIAEGPAKAAGEAIGKQAADAALAERTNDNTSLPDTYRPLTTPGVWIPTTPPIAAQYARVRPWSLERPDQLRPGPPPALNSAQFARDYNETKDLGGVRSTARTPEQNNAVKFWSQSNFTESWFQAARQAAVAKQLRLADSARLLAIVAMAAANSFIVDWDAKFHYNFWRPITAIRNGDNDGNDATERDAGWTPLNATPMHPEYPSQAAILAGLGSAAIALAGAADMPLTIVDSADPKITRSFANAAKLAEEQRLVRIWGGIHFRTSLEVSDVLGTQIVKQLDQTTYRPVR